VRAARRLTCSFGWAGFARSGRAKRVIKGYSRLRCDHPDPIVLNFVPLLVAQRERLGLPSRRAAFSAIEDLDPAFTDNSGMVEWLRSNEVTALSNDRTWPTEDTAALWRQFRSDVLAGQTQRWTIDEWARNVDQGSFRMDPELNRTYRVEITPSDAAWICTPDFGRIVRLRRSILNPRPSVLMARFGHEMRQVTIRRVGRGTARWSESS
jgi:hypothetical protein